MKVSLLHPEPGSIELLLECESDQDTQDANLMVEQCKTKSIPLNVHDKDRLTGEFQVVGVTLV